MRVLSLFPTAVGMFKCDNLLTEIQRESLLSFETGPNEGNKTSKNRNVLDLPEFTFLKEFFLQKVNTYVAETIIPKNKVDFYITQSWLNYTTKGEYHHRHSHANSVVSGVYYVNTNVDNDRIVFYKKEDCGCITLPTENFNLFNSTSWWVNIETDMLVLFPSTLKHDVPPVEGNETRASLAFNTFVKGYIGEDESLTGLHL